MIAKTVCTIPEIVVLDSFPISPLLPACPFAPIDIASPQAIKAIVYRMSLSSRVVHCTIWKFSRHLAFIQTDPIFRMCIVDLPRAVARYMVSIYTAD